jgi:hypothetical protein
LTLGSIDCVGAPASPFPACPDGSATYADPSSCCLLPTSDGGGTSGCSLQPQPPTLPLVKTPKTCTYPCTSGLIYVPSRNSCCPIKGELDAGACEPPIAYSCPDESPDAQSNCVNEFCGTCPTGWSAMMSAPEICCRTQGVATWCFSRAVGPGTSTAHLP